MVDGFVKIANKDGSDGAGTVNDVQGGGSYNDN